MKTEILYLPLERTGWFVDYDGVLTTTKRKDEVKDYPIDFTDWLDTSETVSSVSMTEVDGPTISTALATPQATLTVEDTGEATLQATLSTGRILEKRLRWQGIDNASRRDYSGRGRW